jgi:hypothetical protein
MKIDDFEHSGGKTGSRFVTRVQDVSGDEEFELTIAGPRELVRRVLADDATIELTIDSSQSEDQVKAMIDERREEQRQAMWSLAGLEDLDALFKPAPASPQRETSVVTAIRPVSGEGTPFALSISGFTVPAGASAFFFGSFVAYATGALVPATGDQDLFLHLFSTTGPVVSSSRASFTAPDVVWFTFPFPFVPVFQVFGFTTGVCANFSAFGT